MEHNWEYYKDVLQQQFVTDNKTLGEVIEFMNDTYNFRARYLLLQDFLNAIYS